MASITNHYFNDETTETTAPNSPIRSLTKHYFGGVSVEDSYISPKEFIASEPLSVNQQPQSDLSIAAGNAATIGPVAATGGKEPYTYQWKKNDVALQGQSKGESYTTDSLSAEDNGAKYNCSITDAENVTVDSEYCTITVTS